VNTKKTIEESIQIKQRILADEYILSLIASATEMIVTCLETGGKVLWCGNGGSAADSQHLAAELSGRFYLDRKALHSEALHLNGSYLTAAANDYGFDQVFARAIEAKGKMGDVLVVMSTSGKSKNILNAIDQANEMGLKIIALTGEAGIKDDKRTNANIRIPSTTTPRIQECHMLIGHIICEEVEKKLFAK